MRIAERVQEYDAMASDQSIGYILVVEDNDAIRDVLCEALARAGHTVRGVRLAAQALQAVSESPPVAILLDIVMPPGEMNGIDALFALRRSRTAAQVPVIVMSGIADLLDPETMEHLNVYATVPKPLSVTALADQIGRLVADVARAPSA
jgi:DNA-binding NtrC family response regulator